VTDLSGRIKGLHPVPSFNGSPLIAHRIDRSPFVSRETAIVYNNGVATSVSHKKPSEGLGLVTSVGSVAGAIVFAPVNALTAQTTKASKETQYLQAREALLKQQQTMAPTVAANHSAQGNQTNFSNSSLRQGGNPSSVTQAESSAYMKQFQQQQDPQQQTAPQQVQPKPN
jgi:hypothetical protein